MPEHQLPTVSQEVAHKLRQRRINLGLTQMELAEKANVDWKTIHRIENHKCITNIELFFELAFALGLTPNDLAPTSYCFNTNTCCIKNLDSRFHDLSGPNQKTFIASVNALLDGFISQQNSFQS